MTAYAVENHQTELTAASLSIGQTICMRAYWHEDRCNWVGAEPLERDDKRQSASSTHRSLGPDLYGGTSGVALYLAELAAATGDEETAQTARGAIKHAFAQVERIPPDLRLGLHTGWTGIAFAACRIGTLLDEREWQERALVLMKRTSGESAPPGQFDLISGRAGAIIAALIMSESTGERELMDTAVRWGDELVGSATFQETSCSWSSEDVGGTNNLTGLSHGTAGAAHALFELFSVTKQKHYRDAAQSAMNYERKWFVAEAGNWPDFRSDHSGRRTKTRPTSRFSTFWCHGAPGIALARMYAYQQQGEEKCREEANAAIETTKRAVRLALDTGTLNFSLCHGLCGNAETLLEASRNMGLTPEDDDCKHLCEEVAHQGLERHAHSGLPWPCGTHTGETPGLMLGLAGIGHFYLRLANPIVPSVLLPVLGIVPHL